MLATSDLLERALECLPATLGALRRRERNVEQYVLTALDATSDPWSVLAASLYARAHDCDLAEAKRVSAAAFDVTRDPALVAAVSVRDLRAFLSDVLIANEDLEALIEWLDRPVVADHIRVPAVSGGDIRAGQFRCTGATQRRPHDLH